MRYDETDGYQRYLTVKVIDDILTPGLGDMAETCREAELQAHHRQTGVTDRDRELRPEIARWWQRTSQEREQWGENEEQIHKQPNSPSRRIRKHRVIHPLTTLQTHSPS